MTRDRFFTPEPPNVFEGHIKEYYERVRERSPTLDAVCGKWDFDDLIPGLSDFDARFIFSDGTQAEDWPEISRAVGEVHTAICREDPSRARILEHLPGINLIWSEVMDPLSYYPEFKQWTFYHGPDGRIDELEDYLTGQPWNSVDELFSLKKFATYYTPYDRDIDPPINLHEFESKYPLHSRVMHYFCPPLQSLVSIRLKRMIRGKHETFSLARDCFAGGELIDEVFDILECHYEKPELYDDPRQMEFETKLYDYLVNAYRTVAPMIEIFTAFPGDTRREILDKCALVSTDLWSRLFAGVKFSRLMMGRLCFYAESIPHFDSIWLIENELKRLINMFYVTTLTAFGVIIWGDELLPEEVLNRLRGKFLTVSECEVIEAFADIFNHGYEVATIKDIAREIAKRMESFQKVLEKLMHIAREHLEERSELS